MINSLYRLSNSQIAYIYYHSRQNTRLHIHKLPQWKARIGCQRKPHKVSTKKTPSCSSLPSSDGFVSRSKMSRSWGLLTQHSPITDTSLSLGRTQTTLSKSCRQSRRRSLDEQSPVRSQLVVSKTIGVCLALGLKCLKCVHYIPDYRENNQEDIWYRSR